MNIQKIFSWILILFILWFFLVQMTYNTSSQENVVYDIPRAQTGIYLLKQETGADFETVLVNTEIEHNMMYKELLNSIDSVYFLSPSDQYYTKNQTGRNISFELSSGIFFFDLTDMSYEYEIFHKWFRIDVTSAWKFYIDTTQSSDIKIFSLDGIIRVTLVDSTKDMTNVDDISTKDMTNIILYPHMYFSFNSIRNSFLKNADLFRVSSVAHITYLSNIHWDIAKSIFSQMYTTSDDVKEQFLNQFFSYSQQKSNHSKNIRDILLQDNVTNIPWLAWIQKYRFLFFNDAKKKVFLKNYALFYINDALRKNDSVWWNIDEIKNLISQLREIDSSGFTDLQDIVSYYYKFLFSYGTQKDLEKIFFLWNILWHINDTWDLSPTLTSSVFLNNMYQNFHNNIGTNRSLHSSILHYIDFLFQEHRITFDRNNYVIQVPEKSLISLDYIAFFLSNILIYDTTFESEQQVNDFANMLWVYYAINSRLAVEKKWTQTENILLEYEKVLQSVLAKMRQHFFEPRMSSQDLLVQKPGMSFSSKTMNDLNQSLQLLFRFFDSYKGHLTEKNQPIRNVFERYKTQLKEYIAAAGNYSQYLTEYDTSKKDLLPTQTIWEQGNQSQLLNAQRINNFLASFEQVDISHMTKTLKNNEYYIVENFQVWNLILKFELYPLRNNTIENIYVNEELKNNSYELDTLEEIYKKAAQNMSSSDPEEAQKYNFKRFFVTTFLSSNSSSDITFFDAPVWDSSQEDRTIVVFKRDKLLGSDGEFSVLKWFMEIPFSSLDVRRNTSSGYDIVIRDAKLSLNSNQKDIIWTFQSQYLFSQTQHDFQDMKILFQIQENDHIYNMLWGNSLRIPWTINILSIKWQMQGIIDTLVVHGFVYDVIQSQLWVSNIDISFKDNVFIYQFSYQNKLFLITQNLLENEVTFGWARFNQFQLIERLKEIK